MLLLIALMLGLVAIAADFERLGGAVALLCGSFGLWLTASHRSVTFDVSQQKVFFAMHYPLYRREQRGIPFEKIVAVHLDHWEQVVSHGDSTRIRRKWTIFFALGNGQVITVASETTEHPASQTSVLARQLAYWEDLSARICAATGKLLIRAPSIPGPPHTFVEQIDQIVQRRLAQSHMNDQVVRLHSRTDGGLEIVIDGRVHQDLNLVDDISVRNLIQAAVDEWQDSK